MDVYQDNISYIESIGQKSYDFVEMSVSDIFAEIEESVNDALDYPLIRLPGDE